jgi:hypothetical protein
MAVPAIVAVIVVAAFGVSNVTETRLNGLTSLKVVAFVPTFVMAGMIASTVKLAVVVLVCPSVSVPLTWIVKTPFAAAISSGAVQDVPLPVTLPAVTEPDVPPVTDVTNALVSGLLEAIVSCGADEAFAGFGVAVAVRVGRLKSKTTDALVCELFPTSSVAAMAMVCVPEPSEASRFRVWHV